MSSQTIVIPVTLNMLQSTRLLSLFQEAQHESVTLCLCVEDGFSWRVSYEFSFHSQFLKLLSYSKERQLRF